MLSVAVIATVHVCAEPWVIVDVNATSGAVALSSSGPFASGLRVNGTAAAVTALLQTLTYRATDAFQGNDTLSVTAVRKTQTLTRTVDVVVNRVSTALGAPASVTLFDEDPYVAMAATFTTAGMQSVLKCICCSCSRYTVSASLTLNITAVNGSVYAPQLLSSTVAYHATGLNSSFVSALLSQLRFLSGAPIIAGGAVHVRVERPAVSAVVSSSTQIVATTTPLLVQTLNVTVMEAALLTFPVSVSAGGTLLVHFRCCCAIVADSKQNKQDRLCPWS